MMIQYKNTTKSRTNPAIIEPMMLFEIDKLYNQTVDNAVDGNSVDGECVNGDEVVEGQTGFNKNAPSVER